MKQVKEILIRVTLDDGRCAEAFFIRREKVAEIMSVDSDLGQTMRDLVESIPEKQVPS